jgi:hypothetical protein
VACVRVRAEGQWQHHQQQQTRRALLLQSAGAAVVGSLIAASPAAAEFVSVPKGFKRLVDKLDGYEFFYPELWSPVTTSGNDVFLRNPFNIEENLFIDISSPSSSRYSSVLDLGTPDAAAKTKLDQYLNKEFMSTRLGGSQAVPLVATSFYKATGMQEYTASSGRFDPLTAARRLHADGRCARLVGRT